MGTPCHHPITLFAAGLLAWGAMLAVAGAQPPRRPTARQSLPPLTTPSPAPLENPFFASDEPTSPSGNPTPRHGLLSHSIADDFARETEERPLYVLTPPRWRPGDADWLESHHRITTDVLNDPDLAGPPLLPQAPTSLWQRWRERRRAVNRQPGSWLRYPFYFEKFTGILGVDEPVHDQIHNGVGNLFGGRWGWDFARYMGVETRLGYVRATLNDTLHPVIPSHENFLFWDADLMFYPLGDTKWRPFAMLGMGLVDLGYIDDRGREWHQQLITMPFAVGIKYRMNNLNALRLDVTDNVIFGNNQGGNGQHVMHNISVLFAFERRFGLPHRSYFPSRDASQWARFKSWLATMKY